MKGPGAERVVPAGRLERGEHLLGAGLHVRPEVEQGARRGPLEEQGGESGREDGALLVCALPPGVRELEMNSGQAPGGEEPGDDRPGVGLDHPEVLQPAGPRPVVELARVLLPPLDGHVADPGMARCVAQGEGSGPGANLQLQRPGPTEHRRPVRGGQQREELGTGRFRSKEWTSGHEMAASAMRDCAV